MDPFGWHPKAAAPGLVALACIVQLASAKRKLNEKQECAENHFANKHGPPNQHQGLPIPPELLGSCAHMAHGHAPDCAVPHVGVQTLPMWKEGPAPSGGQAALLAELPPRLLVEMSFPGSCFVQVSRVGGLMKVQPAGPRCLIEVEGGPPSQKSQRRVHSGGPPPSGHSVWWWSLFSDFPTLNQHRCTAA